MYLPITHIPQVLHTYLGKTPGRVDTYGTVQVVYSTVPAVHTYLS